MADRDPAVLFILITAHISWLLWEVQNRGFSAIERALARLITDRIVVVSEQQRREINEVFHVGRAQQFTVIPLGIDTGVYANWQERRASVRDEVGATESDVLVGIVGRLTEIKNHSMFLAAAARYLQTFAGDNKARVRFLIIGDGNLRRDLEEQVQSLGLSEAVTFMGSRSDPENFYPALDLVALTSHNEGTPLTLIEAMANGRPVLATEVGGVPDLLGPPVRNGAGFAICERGLMAQPGDVEGFAAGMAAMIDDRELQRRLGEQAGTL